MDNRQTTRRNVNDIIITTDADMLKEQDDVMLDKVINN